MGQVVAQAAVGQVNRVTGEPVAAGTVGFVVGGVAALVVAVAINGTAPPHGWGAAAPVEWLGGVIGAGIASWLFAKFGIQFGAGWLGFLIAGFVGACLLILATRMLYPARWRT